MTEGRIDPVRREHRVGRRENVCRRKPDGPAELPPVDNLSAYFESVTEKPVGIGYPAFRDQPSYHGRADRNFFPVKLCPHLSDRAAGNFVFPAERGKAVRTRLSTGTEVIIVPADAGGGACIRYKNVAHKALRVKILQPGKAVGNHGISPEALKPLFAKRRRCQVFPSGKRLKRPHGNRTADPVRHFPRG
ncbi:unknown [Candidatus Colimorpha enterica]|uniref:Uncharacterized protein n=1 Tax=Candidatus Colimorpha enterica TaxID=3083063 RepID=R6TM51_9BACT|nr:unknown [Candidatus Colimorpha enterica]